MSKKRSINNGNKRILEIAIPSIISNITVPLLGLIDVTIVGHLGAPAYIGAIAVGGLLFNIIYWIFGFLRMGTSGMTSQAYGKRDLDEVTRLLLRSVGGYSSPFACYYFNILSRKRLLLLLRPAGKYKNLPLFIFVSAYGEHLPCSDFMASPDGLSACRTPDSRCISPLRKT